MADSNETAIIVVVSLVTLFVLLFLNAGCKRVRHAEVVR